MSPQPSDNQSRNPILILAITAGVFLVGVFLIAAIVVTNWAGRQSSSSSSSNTSGELVGVSLKIISGSENKTLEPIIGQFNKDTGAKVELSYMGSVDILLKLNANETQDVDAAWPASSLIFNLTSNTNLKYSQSILRSPVVLGIKKNIAQKEGWDKSSSIKVNDLLTALTRRDFKLAMTNATQSNSGLSGYLAFLQAFAGTTEPISSADLKKDEVQNKTRALLSLINRSSGSSGWLKDLLLQKYDSLDAMINYESVVIETNQELEKQGKAPLQAIYLEDGMVVADSPLAYVDKKDAQKEKAFLKLQEYLSSKEVATNLQKQGRRTGLGLQVDTSTNGLDQVFRSDWGIKSDISFVSLKYPKKEVIEEMLNLYQISLRKPSLTYYVVDVSGSMQGKGLDSLKEAMRTIINQESAKKYFLQTGNKDVSVIIPFNDKVLGKYRFEGNSEETIRNFSLTVEGLQAGGGTDLYTPLVQASKDIQATQNNTDYFPAIILMTDGKSQNEGALSQIDTNQDIPVFPILFGDADPSQLDKIVKITSGKVFDGRKDLVSAFREAKGYN
ncbi:MAG: substrate-binding and VWA domain-containing protein [bacterium]